METFVYVCVSKVSKIMKEQIIEKFIELFRRFGVKNITMDELSSQLGISKKTLYQHFSSKKELLKESARHFTSTRIEKIKETVARASDGVEALFLVMKFILQEVRQVNPALLYEIQKYYPEAHRIFEEHFDAPLREIMEEILRQGKKDGFFRKSINEEIVSHIYIISKQAILEIKYNLLEKFELSDIIREYLYLFVSGVSTEKGLKRIKELHIK